MSRIRTAFVGLIVAGTALGGVAVAVPAASADTTGYDVCVPAGTPVETGPGGSTVYTMTGSEAWHVYDTHDNQWTDGYAHNAYPTPRGWVWGGHFDGRTPVVSADRTTATCY